MQKEVYFQKIIYQAPSLKRTQKRKKWGNLGNEGKFIQKLDDNAKM